MPPAKRAAAKPERFDYLNFKADSPEASISASPRGDMEYNFDTKPEPPKEIHHKKDPSSASFGVGGGLSNRLGQQPQLGPSIS